jgi:glycine/D-amino acid oxidase-like deaminating enzyme
MSVEEVAARFPAFKTSNLGGYLNPVAGWAESGRVVLKLTEKAQSMGVVVRQVATTKVLTRQGISGKKAVEGIQTSDGKVISSPQVVVAAGASTPWLLPQLREFMWASAQPVLHFARPANSPHYDPVQFIVYAYETAKSGFYGFPCHPSDQRIKIGNHGRGYKLLEVTDESLAALWKKVQPFETKRFRDFCKQSFPDLVDAPIIFTRLCCYCDTFDGNFWIDRDPSTDGLTVAAGGSGHGFKFGPVLGRLIADAVEGKKNKWGDRFLWRTPQPGVFVKEEMRNLNSPTSSL